MTQKAEATKEKHKSYYIKIKNFCTSNNTITILKRQPVEWVEIFAKHMSDMSLTSKKYKELQFNNNNKN
jgi:hypothetical protein